MADSERTGQPLSQTFQMTSAPNPPSVLPTTSPQGMYAPSIGMLGVSPHARPPSGHDSMASRFNQPYHPLVESPGSAQSQFREFAPVSKSGPGTPNVQHSLYSPPGGLQTQKRAYRQRRKDPSCDACRERKVKCDATDNASCSECTSRNVKCQFTKDSNKRMSSIKQVQDLEKQLAQAKQQLNQLRSHSGDVSPIEARPSSRSSSQIQDYDARPAKRQKISSPQDFSRIRSDLCNFGRGIFKPPQTYQQKEQYLFPRARKTKNMELPELPPKHMADELLYLYHISFHATFPMVDWQSFSQTFDSVYRQQSLRDVPQAWIALLFAVFACGTLPRHLRNGEEYSEVSRKLLDLATDDLTLDHVRTAVLTSVFLVELNRKSAGWTWLGIAIRIAQDVGLHLGHVKGQYMDQVIKRPVWWTIYVCDRLLSLELGRSAMISDTDCEPDLSSPGKKGGSLDDGRHSQSPLVPIVHIIQDISRLLTVLKEPVIPTSMLHFFDTLFEECMAVFPAHHQINAPDYIDPHQTPPIIYLQNARLMLHRHNIRIKDTPGLRSAAIDQCARVAKDTTRFLARCMQDAPGPSTQFQSGRDPWKGSLVSAASAFFCTHIWRCALFLSFRSDYEGALLCAQASASVGNARPVNVACGRYLEFFLQRLTSRPLEGPLNLDGDEELVVLASGDLQGSAQNSWVWKDGEGGQQLSQSNPVSPVNPTPITAVDEDLTWSNWDGIIDPLERLLNGQRQRQQQQHKVPLSLPSQMQPQPVHLASPISPGDTETPQSSSSRIRIADIM